MTLNPPNEIREESTTSYIKRREHRVRCLRFELEERYPVPTQLTLEAGCGHGHFLTAFASQHPNSTCLGVDVVSKRIRKALSKRDKRDLDNLHFVKGALDELLEALPARISLERIFMLFPDPWPKKRHHKHRMLQAQLLTTFANRATTGCKLHFRSDHSENFAWAMQQISDHPNWRIDSNEPWPFEHSSFFQELMESYQSFTAVKRINS